MALSSFFGLSTYFMCLIQRKINTNAKRLYSNYSPEKCLADVVTLTLGEVDVNVAADDVGVFLADFGRSQFNNPCPPSVAGAWCNYQ
jgi:hypothetical protein